VMAGALAGRLRRERRTIDAMIGIYCRHHHGTGPDFCGSCGDLAKYAAERLDRCPFGADKPTCANCKVHCYRAEMRERVRTVMRYAGPRMLLRHPVLAVMHKWVDARREAPEKPPRRTGPTPSSSHSTWPDTTGVAASMRTRTRSLRDRPAGIRTFR
jgi:hypothetical protein